MKVGADNSSVDIILMMILGESLIAGRVTFLVCHAKYSPYPSKHVFHSNRNASHPEVPWEEHSCIKTYSDPEELLCFPPPLVCKILIMKINLKAWSIKRIMEQTYISIYIYFLLTIIRYLVSFDVIVSTPCQIVKMTTSTKTKADAIRKRRMSFITYKSTNTYL